MKDPRNKNNYREDPTPKKNKNTFSHLENFNFKSNKLNYNKSKKFDNHYEGSVSENEREFRSNNFLNLKNNFSPVKKELNRSQSPHCDKEYLKLENQIKEMQNQINSMNTDFTLNRCFTSKSFGIFNNTGNNNIFDKSNTKYLNPFIDHEKLNNLNNSIIDNNKNQTTDNSIYNKKLREEENILNNNLNKLPIENNLNNLTNNKTINTNNTVANKNISLDLIQDSNKKELNTISYVTPQNIYTNNINKNFDSDNISNINLNKINKQTENVDIEYKYKMEVIEEKIGKMENDIFEIKGNFNKLYDSIIKLIDFANINYNPKNNINSFNSNFQPISNPQNINNRNENFYNQIDPSNYNNNLRNNQNYNTNIINQNKNQNNIINEVNNSQRLNTQASKISANDVTPMQNYSNTNNHLGTNNNNKFITSTNSISNSNNEALNFILAECNKLKNHHINREYFSDNFSQENNFNSNYGNFNYNNPNLNNYNNYDNQEVNYFESPRNLRNDVLLNSNSLINQNYNDIPQRKNLVDTNNTLKRTNKIIDGSFQNENEYNNYTGNNVDFENSNFILIIISNF